MADLSNERLMAYADDELDGASRAEVEAALREDPAACRRLEIFLATGAPVQELFEPLLKEPVPAHIVRLVRGPAKPVGAGGTVLPLASRLKSAGYSKYVRWQTLIAASLVNVVAITALILYLRQTAGEQTELVSFEDGQIFAQGPFEQVLETAPSGTKVAFEGEDATLSAETLLTFRNRSQAFCRQYEVTTSKIGYAGIACRDSDGRWRVEIHVPVPSHASDHRGDRIAPAGRTASDVEAAVGSVINGDALGREEERALIEHNWQVGIK